MNKKESPNLADMEEESRFPREREIALGKRINIARNARAMLAQEPSEEQREELSRQIDDGMRARDELVETNMGLVYSQITKYANKGVEFEDLAQEGKIGLIKAANEYDWETGNRFSTYAYITIEGTYKKAIRDQSRPVHLVRDILDGLQHVSRATRDLSQRLQREPSVEELAKEMDVPVKKVEELIIIKSHQHVTPLDAEPGFGLDISDPNVAVEEQGIENVLLENLRTVLSDHAELPCDKRNTAGIKGKEALRMSFFEGYTQKEIGTHFGTDQGKISRAIHTALAELRAQLNPERLF